ncbi:unnamed protein product [Blepharisma stoltei]|uniref:Transmembrane protein n=1 Tax=Blepharisma stoltei TaxID=1481888 RepID=A0AAU9IR04_9CILI|nr:unnamed protein product [Blepharisma stoltei]
MIKSCTLQETVLFLFVSILIGLTLYLSISRNYLGLKDLDEVHLGLLGAAIEGDYEEYSDLIDSCNESILSNYCERLEPLQKGGRVLFAFLIIDLAILLVSQVLAILQQFLFTRIVKEIQVFQEPRKILKNSAKCVVLFRMIIFLHPILILIGLVLWLLLGEVEKLHDTIKLGDGIIILIVQCFLSLFLTAFSFWQLSSAKRRRLRFLLSNPLKNESVYQEKTDLIPDTK